IIDGEESDGCLSAQDFTFGGGGKRTGYVSQPDPSTKVAMIDGAPVGAKSLAVTELRFSDDGSHYGFLCVVPGAMHFVLDGTENRELQSRPFQAWPGSRATSIVMSRDGKHVALFGLTAADPQAIGRWIDGKIVPP